MESKLMGFVTWMNGFPHHDGRMDGATDMPLTPRRENVLTQ